MVAKYFRGHVENGLIVLDEPADLADGMQVEVCASRPLESNPDSTTGKGRSGMYDSLLKYAGMGGDDLPEDFAEQHDHYIHGTPKR